MLRVVPAVFVALVAKSLLAECFIVEKVYLANIGPGAAVVALLLSPCLLMKRRCGMYAIAVDFLATLLLVVDVVYARGFEGCASIYSLFAANVFADVADSAAALVKWTDFLWFADIPLIAWWLSRRSAAAKTAADPCGGTWRYAYFPLVALTAVLYINLSIARWDVTTLVTQESSWVECLTPFGYHYYDIWRFIQERTCSLSDSDRETISRWLEANSASAGREGAPQYARLKGVFAGKNLLMLHMESTEGFLVGYEHEGQEVTPNLNWLASHALRFDAVYEQVGNGNSSDAELMALTSWYPVQRGCAFLRFGGVGYQSLPKVLKTLGYRSFAIHGDEAKFWNRETVFRSMGFDDYVSQEDFGECELYHMGVDDMDYFATFAETCKAYAAKGPYFAYGISLTSHLPFTVDEKRCFLETSCSGRWVDYLQSQRYLDECLGRFIADMRREGLLKNTVLAVFGDHQGIHKYFPGDAGPLPENALRVPFIVYCEDVDFAATELIPAELAKVTAVGGQIDMLPTLSYLFGLDSVTNSEGRSLGETMMGRNLLRPVPDGGAAILWDGTEVGEPDELLKEAWKIGDMTIRGDFYGNTSGNNN